MSSIALNCVIRAAHSFVVIMIMLVNHIDGSSRSCAAGDCADHGTYGGKRPSGDGPNDGTADSADDAALFHVMLGRWLSLVLAQGIVGFVCVQMGLSDIGSP